MKPKIYGIIFACIFILHLFLRFNQLETYASFGWDQVDNAWATYRILVDHHYPLVGIQAKNNSGIFIGPLYYYLITPIYFLTNLDPIASPIIAGFTSIFSLLVLFWISQKIFNTEIALIAIVIDTISYAITVADRTQLVINFIAPLSYLIFYFLYKTLRGEPKNILPLAIMIGLMFHVHITAIFFPFIVLCTLPFFPRTLETLIYICISIPIFLLFFIPNMIFNFSSKNSLGLNLEAYITTYYHGLHLTRILQLTHDAFIQFEVILFNRFIRPYTIIFYPIFLILSYIKKPQKNERIIMLLFGIWFIIPWLILSVYKGEITEYYFQSTLFIAIAITSYIIYYFLSRKNLLIKCLGVCFLGYYAVVNLNLNFHFTRYPNIRTYKNKVNTAIQNGTKIEYVEGNPESYLYIIKTRKK